jgi:hypothetical protein
MMGPELEQSYRGSQVKIRSVRQALVQHDWWPSKKGKFGRIQPCTEGRLWRDMDNAHGIWKTEEMPAQARDVKIAGKFELGA